MYRNVVTDGLVVQTSFPAPYAYDIEVETSIMVEVNVDLQPNSIIGNFLLIEDTDWSFQTVDQLVDREKFPVVKGQVTYKDRKLTFNPTQSLKSNQRYVLYLKKNGLKAIDGSVLAEQYVSTFHTITDEKAPQATFMAPTYGLKTTKVPMFRWENQASSSYLFSISTLPDFSIILHETVIYRKGSDVHAPCEYQPEILLKDGMYYARVRAVNGSYSEPLQFYIQAYEKSLVTELDHDDSVYLDDFLADQPTEVRCVKLFPEPGSIQVKSNIQLCYLTLEGKVEEDQIDWQRTYVEGLLYDEEDEETEEQGEIEGEWSLIYDEVRDLTYAIFEVPVIEEELPTLPDTDEDDFEDDEPEWDGTPELPDDSSSEETPDEETEAGDKEETEDE